MSRRILLAQVFYDPFTGSPDTAMSVEVPQSCAEALCTFSDFDLKVLACEAGIRVRNALELPPSPQPDDQ